MFGEIVDGKMICNECGKIVQSCWDEIPEHYGNVELDAFRVMPNHVHGIINIIDDSAVGATFRRPDDEGRGEPRPYKNVALGNIVAYFKYQSAKTINALRHTPGTSIWQRNYFDHIIRNQRSLDRIREYIRTNPERWR